MNRPFDFAAKFRDATFCVATHGDGEAAWLVHGWGALVREYATHCINFNPEPADIEEAAATLIDTEEWQWSAEHPSAPYSLNFSFEDGAFQIYRLSTPTPASPPATAAAAESLTLREALTNLAHEVRYMLKANPDKRGGLYEQRLKEAEAALTAAGQATPQHPSAQMLPPLPGLKGRRYYAEDSDGNWYYINHANTWQTCPPITSAAGRAATPSEPTQWITRVHPDPAVNRLRACTRALTRAVAGDPEEDIQEAQRDAIEALDAIDQTLGFRAATREELDRCSKVAVGPSSQGAPINAE